MNYKHGGSKDRTYFVWQQMFSRCQNPNHADYKNYGGRGIRVIRRWESYEDFMADMGPRPEGMTLERKNVNGNYSKRNCKWASNKEQQRNKRNNVMTLPLVRRIRRQRANGARYCTLAARYKTSRQLIRYVCIGRIWA
jgi:hypothetical protein